MSPEPARRRLRPGTIAAVTFSVLILGMWGFVYIWGAIQKPVDKLDSPAFARRAEPICAVTAAQLAALPPAFKSKTNVDRANVVAQSNVDLRAMLAKLAAVAPTSGSDAHVVHEWLSDYGRLVSDRESYATRLRTDAAARYYETEIEPGEQISIAVDSLATANKMNSCTTPEDLS
jgi:hypothetical protein